MWRLAIFVLCGNAAIKVGLNDKPTNPMVKAKKLIL